MSVFGGFPAFHVFSRYNYYVFAVFVYVSKGFNLPCFIIYHFPLFFPVEFCSDAYFDVSSSVYAIS